MELKPRLIFWEITQECNLSCAYCRRNDYLGGLSKEEAFQIIDSVTERYSPLLVFSGGEPLLHPHLFEISLYARQKGLKIALATNGTLIDEKLTDKIKAVDFHRVAISLDSVNKNINDSLRGEGTFFKTFSGIEFLKEKGIALQINTTVTRKNLEEISSIYNFCLDYGVGAWHIFGFVPVGCGISLPEEERLSKREYEELIDQVAQIALESKIEIRMTCAPFYQRILLERQKSICDNPRVIRDNQRLKGCLAGSGVCFISATGEVYPCGYLPISAGNALKDSFSKIWQESTLFNTLRNAHYLKGKCGVCEYGEICSGCRARAYASSGDYLEEEPDCLYQPLSVKS